MSNFFKFTKAKIIFFALFIIEAIHASIGFIIEKSCGDAMSLCAPAPGAIPYAIVGLVLFPIKAILFPAYFITKQIIALIIPYFGPCSANTASSGENCYLLAFLAFIILAISYYFYLNFLAYLIGLIKKKNRKTSK